MNHWSDRLKALNACAEAVEWARGQKSLSDAWRACQRGDWMLWLVGKSCRTLPQRQRLTMAACACAREALVHVRPGEGRPLHAIETAEAWCRGEAMIPWYLTLDSSGLRLARSRWARWGGPRNLARPWAIACVGTLSGPQWGIWRVGAAGDRHEIRPTSRRLAEVRW